MPAPPAPAAAASAAFFPILAQHYLAAFNNKHLPFHQSFRELSSGAAVYALHCGAADVHLLGALFLREVFQINEPDGFILVYSHVHNVLWAGVNVQGAETAQLGQTAHPTPFPGPWYGNHLASGQDSQLISLALPAVTYLHYNRLPTYVNYAEQENPLGSKALSQGGF